MKVTIDINRSLEQNASLYFDEAKKLKKKVSGVEATIASTNKKLKKEERKVEQEMPVEKVIRKKQWYEKFRWFISSEGFLVIGGRDATTNEIIIKKHAEKEDLVFHTDMAGSPFFVVKSLGKKIGSPTLEEAANATCSFSRAWKLGLGASDVFYVEPDQVSKEAQAGEYLAKGSFMIKGKTNYVDNRMDVAVGIHDGAVMAGPFSAVSSHCKDVLIIEQGDGKPSEIAKKIRSRIGGELDEIIRALPAGGLRLKKS